VLPPDGNGRLLHAGDPPRGRAARSATAKPALGASAVCSEKHHMRSLGVLVCGLDRPR